MENILIFCQILFQLFSNIIAGLSEFGLSLEWGRSLQCEYITQISSQSVDHCYKECASRPGCRSFNYNVRYKRCGLCPTDGESGEFSRSPGFVYSEKASWKQVDVVLSDECDCQVGTSCHVQGSSSACQIKECPMHRWENLGVRQYGNMQAVGNTLVFTCSEDALELQSVPLVTLTCDVNTGNWTKGSIACGKSGYIGCFVDKSQRTLQHGPYSLGQNTRDKCRQTCQRDYYPNRQPFYFGTQVGHQCFCGDRYPIYPKQPETECNSPCYGDRSEICGGIWRISVYIYQFIPIEL